MTPPATDSHPFETPGQSIIAPPANAVEITTHNTNEVSAMTTCVWVGVTGDLAVKMRNGQDVIFPAMIAGMWHPMRVKVIKVTGTTASGRILIGW